MEGSTKVIIGVSVAVVVIAVGAVVYFKVIKPKKDGKVEGGKSSSAQPSGSASESVSNKSTIAGAKGKAGVVGKFNFKKKA
jgi:hypothetical protein